MVSIDPVFAHNRDEVGSGLRKVRTGNVCEDPRQFQRLFIIDRLNQGMRVRTAQHLSMKHSGEGVVPAVLGTACDLVDPVMPDGPSSDYSEVAWHFIGNGHDQPPPKRTDCRCRAPIARLQGYSIERTSSYGIVASLVVREYSELE